MPISAKIKPVIGWREWVQLPSLGIARIKAKIDTGARSSSLHAFDLQHFTRSGRRFVRFKVHPIQRDTHHTVTATCPVLDARSIRSSSGEEVTRTVILADLRLMGWDGVIEVTLANRDQMGFRMLLGREAVRGRFLVDPGRSYRAGGRPKRKKRAVKKA